MSDPPVRNEIGTVNGVALQVGTINGPVTVHVPPEVPEDDPGADPLVVDVRLRNLDYVSLTDGDRVVDVPASGHSVQLIVTGVSRTPVVLAELRVEVLTRTDRSGPLNRHAAAVPRRRFEVLLDATPPRLRALGDTDFPYEVGLHESEAFDLKVVTEQGDVEWVLHLDWVCGRRSGSLRVGLGHWPFRTAARYPGAVR
ncbi:hypothetical protein AB0A63_26885 [Lentzea sp. NPDC042327]|uniref:hypothetical protein n=1 Tax=Lentzea sp. NPDC042327 TaxID=3154801 RepID=UPI0033E6748F